MAITAMPASKTPDITPFINLRSIKYPMIAPNGSESPDRNDSLKAFFLSL